MPSCSGGTCTSASILSSRDVTVNECSELLCVVVIVIAINRFLLHLIMTICRIHMVEDISRAINGTYIDNMFKYLLIDYCFIRGLLNSHQIILLIASMTRSKTYEIAEFRMQMLCFALLNVCLIWLYSLRVA